MTIELYFRLASIFEKHGFDLYLVGGSVRDYLLNKEFNDMDLSTNATLDQIQTFLKFKTMYQEFQSGVFVFENEEIDITTLRKEEKYQDFRHPEKIIFVKSPKEEVLRRDFTINGLYINSKGEILDYVNGKEDLKNHLIRMIEDPLIRLEEDPLRILRALRFAFNLSFKIENNLKKAILIKKSLLKKLNYKKIIDELNKFNGKPKEVRKFLYEYNIEKVIPLFYEYKAKLILDLNCNVITKIYDNKKDLVRNKYTFDLNKMQKGSYFGQVFTVSVDINKNDKFSYIKNVINYYHKLIKENNFFIEEIYNYEDLLRIKKNDKRAAILAIEENGMINNDISLIDELFFLGVRIIKFKDENFNCLFKTGEGLTDFGKKVINKMNELNMIIDIFSTNIKNIEDVLKYSLKPICLSYASNILNLDNVSNLLLKIYENNSLVKINSIEDLLKLKELLTISCLALENLDTNNNFLKNLSNNLSKIDLNKICYLNFFDLFKKNQNAV